MKSLSVFLCLLAVGALMTACEKNNVEELSLQKSMEELRIELQDRYNRHVAEHGEPQINYLTLEEMNKIEIENGLKPTTLEDLGVTEEEYQLAQERINNPELAQSRCNNFYWMLIDIDGGTNANMIDVNRAYVYIAQGLAFGIPLEEFQDFGTISYWREGTNFNLTTRDLVIAQKMLLNIDNECF